uniref:Uncharacterized protein n=1 Tax=Hyaloperonospora arabidopsidis (strain Emoy2) TaxID=559515 RepID=M4B6S3_HYAAE
MVSTETMKSRVTTDKIDPSPVVSRRTRVDGTAKAKSVLATVSPCSSILTVGAHKLVARFLGGSLRCRRVQCRRRNASFSHADVVGLGAMTTRRP